DDQMSSLAMAVMAYRIPASSGEGTTVHSLPSQCMNTASDRLWPTAHTSLDARAATALSQLQPFGFGLGTTVHCEPSQCSMRGWGGTKQGPGPLDPTAHTSSVATALTPNSWLETSGVGAATIVHCTPSQCSISA